MTELRKTIVISGVIALVLGCIGDLLFTFILGNRFPYYSQKSDIISTLGATASPVSRIISLWWVLLGLLIIIFAFGFRTAFTTPDRNVKLSFWLIVIYGLGEGFGSGLFKADLVNNSYTTSYIIHDILGGIGIIAILILPVVVRKIDPFSANTCFLRYSSFVIIAGILFWVFFSLRFFGDRTSFFSKYRGLWQRLFLLDYYLYMFVIGFIMIKKALQWKL